MLQLIDRYFIKQPRLRRFVTRVLEGDREVDIEVLGASLRAHTIKEHGYLRSSRLVRGSALLRDEVPTIINLAGLLSDGDTFIDIGANVGIYSLTLARLCAIQPRTRFYAFEANPDTYARLAERTRALGIQAHNFALSDRNGTLEFVGGAVSHVFTTIENINDYSIPGERISVPCHRLDDVPIEGDSLVLKIDVEGQEKSVLDGALGFFEAGRIKAVYLDGYKDSSIESFLLERHFKLFDGRKLQPSRGGVFSLLAVRQPDGDGGQSKGI